MGLSSAVRARPDAQATRAAFQGAILDPAVLWAVFLTLIICLPWFASGYIFGTDWPGPRRFDFPTALSSSAPLEVAMAILAAVLTAEWTSKLLIFGSFFAAAFFAYRALPDGGFVPRAAASALFVANPFVYGRMHYGQLFLIAGYAVLPWTLIRLQRMLRQPTIANGALTAVSLALVGVFTPHLALVAGVLGIVLTLAFAIGSDGKVAYLQSLAPALAVTAAAALVLSAYWLVPLLLGRGVEGTKVAAIGPGDLLSFASVPDQHVGLVPNLLGLYGFWAEDTARFTSLKAFVFDWPLVLIGLLAVGAIGAAYAFRSRSKQLGPWVAGLLVVGAIALILEMGVSSPATAGITRWLDAHFVFYRGMRDAGKWAAVLGLVYSQLFGLGAVAILGWVANWRPRVATEWGSAAMAGLLLALPLYYGNGLLFGFHGGIRPSQYPEAWYTADQTLLEDPHPGRTLFLPWHLYLSFPFIRNQNEVVACPAPTFFSVPVLYSTDPGVFGEAPPRDRDQAAVASLISAGDKGDWAAVLRSIGVKYILLAKTVDWATYTFLNTQPGVIKVADYGPLILYRVSN